MTDLLSRGTAGSERPATVTMRTSMGDLVIELYWQHAPRTCQNFAELTTRGYYDGTIFHRVVREFMIQGGDPTGTGRGGASIYGKEFDDEIDPSLKHTGAGVLSMANSGPNTNGSQFFITLAPTQWLDGKHSIFGRIKSGMHVVKRIGSVETDGDDRPVDTVRIVSCDITPPS
ncbi:peptidyl-prolyl cis-trans isomerase-like 1 [Folsomia candida]|uniref:Peptidyl-prolyl cis-trans isomerase n=1 Tax=Folsomia candida TaxID=158441 RepID=A0A481SVH9_FOLCA|nr:peptidyl-prolyl cis-trans isomerase-like 1 [Folsomia candida]QBH72995.1 putative mitochondrial ribosomal protein S24 [Folsomia candida]